MLESAVGLFSNSTKEEERKKAIASSGLLNLLNKDLSGFKTAVQRKEDLLSQFTMTDEAFSFSEKDEKAMEIAKGRASAFIANAESLTGAGYDKTTALAELNNGESKISYKAIAPYKEGDPWKGIITIVGTKGKTMEINVDSQSDFAQLTGKKFKDYKINPLKARAIASSFNSTNLGSYTTEKDAWKTAAISSDNFMSLGLSKKYIPLGADLNILPKEKGAYTVTVYLKNKQTGEILKPINFPRIYTDENTPVAHIGVIDDNIIDAELSPKK
jgi:hypothetical protein